MLDVSQVVVPNITFPHYPGDFLNPAEQDEYRAWERAFKKWKQHNYKIRKAYASSEPRQFDKASYAEYLLVCTIPEGFRLRWDRENWTLVITIDGVSK